MKKIMYLMKNGEQRKHAIEEDYVSEEEHKHHEEENKHKHHEEEHKHEESGEMKNSNYFKFIAKHGHHFTKELAKYAVEKLYGNEKISYIHIDEILKQSGEVLSDGDTIADLYFVVNRMKHRHSSQTIKSDLHIVLLSVESLNDPMSDEVFCEWIECMKRRKEEIPWSRFI